ncbi:glycosyltransferase family 39 protein [Candidatus Woesebacteria bacterium]|nr:glycosyltransferase family 39 protein [Candidatus Woesebacteria bacterium]
MHRQAVKSSFLLAAAVAVSLFFRLFKLEAFYGFEYDQDLYSWIVKDILIDHNLRLIGQMTSIDGVFIGPLYYYLLVPFYFVFSMNPLSANFLAATISVLTILSIYWVFSKIFDAKVAIYGSIIYASSLSIAFIDRWVVPTQPTILWTTWFLYCLFKLSKGEVKTLPILGILLGLIWHIHVALLPLVLLIPLCFTKALVKRLNAKLIILSLFAILILTAPFWLFEVRHGFGQIVTVINFANNPESGQKTGVLRLKEVLDGTAAAFSKIIFFRSPVSTILTLASFYLSCLYLTAKGSLGKKQLFLTVSWSLITVFVQQLSNRSLSDYYFNNLIAIGILILSLLLSHITENKKLKLVPTVLLAFFVIYNFYKLTSPIPHENYQQKTELLKSIKKDSVDKNLPCVAINLVADFTKNVGFRYLYWYYNLDVVRPAEDVPVYNVAFPKTLFEKSHYIVGNYAVITPEAKDYKNEACTDPKNQLAPLLGFTN